MILGFIKDQIKIFYLMVLVVMLSATLYHSLVLYFFDLDYYYRVQNISFNILFIVFMALCYKKVLGRSDIKFLSLHFFILLVFVLQLQISVCDYVNFYSYYWSGDLLFLRADYMSALEQYLIPF
jgi:hypothetical protein